jgi:hypothetical protein
MKIAAFVTIGSPAVICIAEIEFRTDKVSFPAAREVWRSKARKFYAA